MMPKVVLRFVLSFRDSLALLSLSLQHTHTHRPEYGLRASAQVTVLPGKQAAAGSRDPDEALSANDLWLCAQESAVGNVQTRPGRMRLTTLWRGQPRRRRRQVGVGHEDIARPGV